METPPTSLTNPYVGAGPLTRRHLLCGRARDLGRLVNMLIVNRLVLLQAPSGAGKTSLIQAGLLPEMQQQGFALLNQESGARLNYSYEKGLQAGILAEANPYVLSLMATLEEGLPKEQQRSPGLLADLYRSPLEYVQQRMRMGEIKPPVLLVIDQFEEILTHDPTNLPAKRAFFDQIALLVNQSDIFLLLSMRGDYLGEMEPYLSQLRTGFRNRYRLELLDPQGAKEAIQKPAAASSVTVTDAAAEILVADLAQGNPYIEPWQLQIVCHNLWQKLNPQPESAITDADVRQDANVDLTLAKYYSDQLQTIEKKAGEEKWDPPVDERQLRRWAESHLLIGQRIRSQVMMGERTTPTENGVNTQAVLSLENAYLVRRELHRGLVFFELAHDRLVRPVLGSNRDFRLRRAEYYAEKGREWIAAGHPEAQLLIGPALQEVEQWWTEIEPHLNAELEPARELLRASQAYRQRLEARLRPPLPGRAERQVNLEDLGWGVIFAAGSDPAVRLALMPLLEHRFNQATAKNPAYYHEFTYPSPGYGTAPYMMSFGTPFPEAPETARQFLDAYGAGAGPVDPAQVPFYLLIVGSPEQIPFEFQYGLDVQYAVGRLDLETADDYYIYARSVLAVEKGQVRLPQKVALGAIWQPEAVGSQLVAGALLEPLETRLRLLPPGWETLSQARQPLDKPALERLLTGDATPSLLFLAGPTLQPTAPTHQPPLQGAFSFGGQGDRAEQIFSAADLQDRLADAPGLLGMAAFLYGSYTAGTPAMPDYAVPGTQAADGFQIQSVQANPPPAPAGPAFVAALPKAMLSHPLGAALAVIGHVERATAYAFNAPFEEPAVFYEILRRLALGYTAGAAKECLDQRYALFLSELGEWFSVAGQARLAAQLAAPDAGSLARMALLSTAPLSKVTDARNYILLGDPAARLPFGEPPAEQPAAGGRELALPPRLVVSAQNAVALRLLPDEASPELVSAPPGSPLDIRGRHPDGTWWAVRTFLPNGAALDAWLPVSRAQEVDAAGVPVINLESAQAAAQSYTAAQAARAAEAPAASAAYAAPARAVPRASQAVELDIRLTESTVEMSLAVPERESALQLPPQNLDLRSPMPDKTVSNPALYGSWLSAGIFSGGGKELWERARIAAQVSRLPLRLRLSIDPAAEALHSLRWETLVDPATGELLVTTPGVIFSLYLWSPTYKPVRLRIPGALRALVAVTSFEKFPGISIPDEIQRAQQVLGNLEFTVLSGEYPSQWVSLDALKSRLESAPCDLLYLVCHATVSHNVPVLYLEDERKNLSQVIGLDFAEMLTQLHQPPRLVVLTSCQSSVDRAGEALLSLAPMLAQAGVLAVLVLPAPIQAETMTRFLTTFFAELFRHAAADRAAAVARQAVAMQPDFWAPVLFSRMRDGRLWLAPGEEPAVTAGQAAAAQAPAFLEGAALDQTPGLHVDHVRRQAIHDRLLAALAQSARDDASGAARSVALLGYTGSGRTQAAVDACRALRDSFPPPFPDGILWAHLHGTPDPNLSRAMGVIRDWLAALTGQAARFASPEDAARALEQALQGRRVLLVINNPPDRKSIELLAGGAQTRRLILAQDRAFVPQDAQVIRIGRMQRLETLKVLGTNLSEPSVALLDRLAARLGDWPLAAVLANRQLVDYTSRGDTLDRVVAFLLGELDERGPVALDVGVAKGVGTSLTWAYNNAQAALDPASRLRLAELVVFPSEKGGSRPVALKLWCATGLCQADAEILARRLDELGLLEEADPARPDALRLHPLFASFLAFQLGEQRTQFLAELHGRLLDAYNIERWTQWPADDAYIWDHAAYHLLEAGRIPFLASLLLNPMWMERRLSQPGGLGGLIVDLERLPDDAALLLVSGALRLSARVLSQDPSQLSAQLLGRLLQASESDSRLRALLSQLDQSAGGRLLPLNAALTPPGGARYASLALPARPGGAFAPACPTALALSADGDLALASTPEGWLAAWDLRRQELTFFQEPLPAPAVALAISPATERPLAVAIDAAHRLTVWDLRTYRLVGTQEPPAAAPEGAAPLPAELAIHPGGRFALATSPDGQLLEWDLELCLFSNQDLEHSLFSTLDLPAPATALTFISDHEIVAGTPDGSLFLISMDDIIMDSFHAFAQPVASLSTGVAGAPLLAVDASGRMLLWKGGFKQRSKPVTPTAPYDSAISPQTIGSSLVAVHPDGSLVAWDPWDGVELAHLPGHTAAPRLLAVSAAGQRAVSAAEDGTLLAWNLARLTAAADRLPPASAVLFDPSGELAALLDLTGSLRLFDLQTRLSGGLALGVHKGRLPLPILEQKPHLAKGLPATPPGNPYVALVALGGSRFLLVTRRGSAVLSDAAANQWQTLDVEQPFPGSYFLADVRMDPAAGGAWLWMLPAGDDLAQDRLVALNLPEAALTESSLAYADPALWTQHLFLSGHAHVLDGQVNALVELPGSGLEVSAGEEGTLRVWDAQTGALLRELSGHRGAVKALVSFPVPAEGRPDAPSLPQELLAGDGSFSRLFSQLAASTERVFVASAGVDGTLRLWNTRTGRQLFTYTADSPLLTCAIAADGSRLLAGDAAGGLHLLGVRPLGAAPDASAEPAAERSALFQPRFDYAWQNPFLRGLIYPHREEMLRQLLLTYQEMDLVHQAGERQDRRRLEAELAAYSARLGSLAHADLLKLMLDRFADQPQRYPDWLKVLAVHYSGMRRGSAHGTWADPAALVGLLEELAARRLEDPAFRLRIAEVLRQESLLAGSPLGAWLAQQVTDGSPPDADPALLNELNQAVLAYLTARDLPAEGRLGPLQALDRLLAMKRRLGLPGWFWREAVSLTDLRLAIAGGDWLTDWEGLSQVPLSERRSPENEPWAQALDAWQEKPSAWRVEHARSFSPLVTRLLSSDVADMAYHLRGLAPAYTPEGRLGWLQQQMKRQARKTRSAQFEEHSYVIVPATREDLRPGASLFRLGWQDHRPYAWEAVHANDELDFQAWLPLEQGWEMGTEHFYGLEVITRYKVTRTRKGIRDLVTKPSQAAASRASPEGRQWLAWQNEAVVVEVASLLEEKFVLVFDAEEKTGLRRIPLKQMLKSRQWLVGYVPSVALDAEAQAALQAHTDRGKLLAPARGAGARCELLPEAAPAAPAYELFRLLAALTPAQLQTVALAVNGASNRQMAYMLDIAPSSVRQRLNKAMQILGVGSLPELRRLLINHTFREKSLQALSSA